MIRLDIQIEAQGKGDHTQGHHGIQILVPAGFRKLPDKPGVDDNGNEKGNPADGQDNSEGFGSKSADIDQIAAFDIADRGTEFPEENKEN